MLCIINFLMQMREKYGDVFMIYLGSRPVVVVNGYQSVKEALVDRGDDFLARGEIPALDAVYKDYGMVLTSNLARWRKLRSFSVTTLRGLGMGKRSIEERIQEEAQHLVTELRKNKESIFDPQKCIGKATCNIICSIMFGSRYEYEDEELLSLIMWIHETFQTISSAWGQLYEMFPWIMKYLPGQYNKVFTLMEKLLWFVEKRVKMNQKTLDASNPRDYIDAFLIQMEKEKEDPHSEFHMTNLMCSTLQIFFSGVDTISTTLTYALLLLLRYQEVQANVHDEIDRIIGRNRSPKLHDRSSMPYTDAVLHEIQRYINLIPLGVPRAATQDVQFRGYTIPKGTNVFLVLGSVLSDPNCFQYPNEFNPENFLDEHGKFKKNDAFVPLAAGKRVCLGEGLVRMELFIFLITILQNFTLKSPLPPEEIDITPNVSGLGNFPKPYKLSFVPH
ncbi:hypothetical protein FKM82_021500 [Ascaphus truei]